MERFLGKPLPGGETPPLHVERARIARGKFYRDSSTCDKILRSHNLLEKIYHHALKERRYAE